MKMQKNRPRANNGIQNLRQTEIDQYQIQKSKIHLSLKKNINEVTLDKYQDKMFTR